MNNSTANNNENEKETDLIFKKMMADIDKAISDSFRSRTEAELALRRFEQEQEKTRAETTRINLLMFEEQAKTRAETQKLQKEARFYPYIAAAGLMGAGAGLVGAIFIKLVDKFF